MEEEKVILVDGIFKKYTLNNKNGRIYSKEELEKLIKDFDSKTIVMGELNHPSE